MWEGWRGERGGGGGLRGTLCYLENEFSVIQRHTFSDGQQLETEGIVGLLEVRRSDKRSTHSVDQTPLYTFQQTNTLVDNIYRQFINTTIYETPMRYRKDLYVMEGRTIKTYNRKIGIILP